MHSHIEYVLVRDNKITRRHPTPQLMNKDNKVVDNQMTAYGIKATTEIFRPDTALACNKVACTLSMDNDKAVV